MIIISNMPVKAEEIKKEFQENGVERDIIDILDKSLTNYKYKALESLKFELNLRKEIIKAAKDLDSSGMNFEVFRESKCNPQFWRRTDEGGFILKEGKKPSDAINDIFNNGSMYGTECATAMIIVYYRALLAVYGEKLFDKTFPEIHLMNWHYIDKNLKEIGRMKKPKNYLPGDRRYFANPDVDTKTPEWQGENVIDLGKGKHYGHGIGIHSANTIIKALNENRKKDADETAYLTDEVGLPNFNKLENIYRS